MADGGQCRGKRGRGRRDTAKRGAGEEGAATGVERLRHCRTRTGGDARDRQMGACACESETAWSGAVSLKLLISDDLSVSCQT